MCPAAMNGIAATSAARPAAASAGALSPCRKAVAPRPTALARTRQATVIASAVPVPPSPATIPQATSRTASPTGPASQVPSRRPQRTRASWPTASEPAAISAAEASAASTGD
jgi:hypothetical protein